MRIRLARKVVITAVSIAASASLAHAGLFGDGAFPLSGKTGVQQVASKAGLGSVAQAAGAVQGLAQKITDIIGGGIGGLEGVVDKLFGGYVKLRCIRPNNPINNDPCENLKKFGNFLGYLSGHGFRIDLKICTLSGSSPNLLSAYNDYIQKMCNKGAASAIEYNPIVHEISSLPSLSTISYSVERSGKYDSSKIVYPSGITQKVLYGGNGVGYYAYKANKDRSSPTAIAYINNDKRTLILKDIAIKTTGKENEAAIGLPKNKDEVEKLEATKAMARYVEPMMDWGSFLNKVEGDLQNEYSQIQITKNTTMADVRQQELQKWQDYIKKDEIKNIYKKQEDMVKSIFSDLQLLETTRSDYVFDPSQARIDLLPINRNKDAEKYRSLVQITRGTMLKGIMGQAIKYKKELLDLSLKKAYVCSIPFRPKVVRNEIGKVLEDVDKLVP